MWTVVRNHAEYGDAAGHRQDLRSLLKSFSGSVGSILWFDARGEHSAVPPVKSHSRRAQGLSRLAASSRPPAGLGLDWPEVFSLRPGGKPVDIYVGSA